MSIEEELVELKKERRRLQNDLAELLLPWHDGIVHLGGSEGLKDRIAFLTDRIEYDERILKDGLDHDLWIVGDGEDRPILEDYIREHRLEQSVFLPGFLDNPYPCIREADLAVCSSSYEGFSTFLTECIILGKPIVTTAVFGTRELLGNSEYGLITANDDESFFNGVKTMLEDKVLRAHYIEKADVRRLSFSTGQLIARTEEFFAEMVGK